MRAHTSWWPSTLAAHGLSFQCGRYKHSLSHRPSFAETRNIGRRPTSHKYVGYALTAITRTANLMRNSASRYQLWTDARLKKVITTYYGYTPTATPKKTWPVRDTEDWSTGNNNWKFWSEWLKTAAISCGVGCTSGLLLEQAYNSFNAQSLKSFGEAPGPVYRWIPF